MEPASTFIDQKIKDLGDWRGKTLAHLRKLIHDADPDIQEEWKWMGTPVFSHDGMVCTGETYKQVVKLTFARGASIDDPKKLFNSSLDGNVRARDRPPRRARRSTKLPSKNSSAPPWRPTPQRMLQNVGQRPPGRSKPAIPWLDR